ncbi:pro-sigmaK processing inhibitor BofA family protein [Caldanaerobius fijiensis]|uniref:pro-sigmaK processing inhibitor BofA family protein n=1 Tax=Caldanaerobius fijiensis TaxID=456330 RepID=UPI00093392AB
MLFSGALWFIIGIIALAAVLWLFSISIKFLFRFILNSIVGFIFLLIFNFFGGIIGLYLPINIATAFVTGFFGIPGIIVLLILKYFFHVI